ncbi:Alpha/Beta hydrolase protein [Aspergillus spinulosporus]
MKWKATCKISVYPFDDARLEDFEPFSKSSLPDAYFEAYTETFLPFAEFLEQRAAAALRKYDETIATCLLLRAAVVFRIARFPYLGLASTGLKITAFEGQKTLQEKVIEHTHRQGQDGTHIPIYLRFPEDNSYPVPCVLILTGLDRYRPDNTKRIHEIVSRGWAVMICEIPGTANCPADPSDPSAPDRMLDSVIALRGLSAGGFYATRGAHTHRTSPAGCTPHGPGAHHFFSQEWLDRIDDHEYPFPNLRAWAEKYGYDDPAEFCKNAQKKFSLFETGILDRSCTRPLLLNGINYGVIPIEDRLLLFTMASLKRFYPGLPHMGYLPSLDVAYKWLEDLLQSGS